MTPDGLTYRLYVPTPGSRTGIRDGSAIVGAPRDDRVDVNYEGGGMASNIVTFEDRITHAAGRRSQDYPTIARASLDPADVVDVGEVRFDGTLRRWVISSIDDRDALDAWTPGPHVVGGSPELRREAAGSIFSRLGSNDHAAYAVARACGTPVEDAIMAIADRHGRMHDR